MTSIFSLLIFQIIVILVVAKSFNLIFRKIQQPQVVGEMFTGIFLGPSILGLLAPDISNIIFPSDSLSLLNALGQIGIIIYLFIVGLELDLSLLQRHARSAVIIGSVSLIIPFFLGVLLGFYINPRFSDKSVNVINFSLFLGTAISVTAFPVLVRILTERNLLLSKVGIIAIACAAICDVIAWNLLAFVVLLVRVSSATTSIWITIIGSCIYVLGMLFIVRKLISRIERIYYEKNNISQELLLVILLLILISAWITDWLGIHTIFGAFFAGVIMPKGQEFVQEVRHKLEDLTAVLFLPLFFIVTGLKTRINLINGVDMWLYCIIIIIVATIGKFGASALAARFIGMEWRDAGAIGILMNTKGLMELVILNIGLEMGIISPSLFAIMVLMTFVTTFMTTPILEWIYSDVNKRERISH